MNVLALIPARGGSKGIARKNLVDIAGRSLIAWTIEAALRSRVCTRVVVSTDDAEIGAVAREAGAEVPFLRPSELADDTAPALAVIRHAITALEAEDAFDALAYLQPTSPFRTARHIDEAAARFGEPGVDVVVSVVRVPHGFTPGSLLERDGAGGVVPFAVGPMRLRRQDKPELYARNGPAILLASPNHFLTRDQLYDGRVIGYEMSGLDSIDIDDADDLALVRALAEWRRSAGA